MTSKRKSIKSAYSIENESEENNILAEPAIAISQSKALGKVVILGQATKKSESHMTSFEKMHVVKQGITKNDLEQLKQKAALDYDMLSKTLNVARATLINKKGNDKFGSVLSEQILSIADLYSYGFEVFGDEQKFRQWMSKPNKAIGGYIPYEIIDNQYGREEVKNLIGRVAYGIYS